MAEYQLTIALNQVLRTGDSAIIPFDGANLDYQVYLAWLATGHVPDPVPTQPKPTVLDSASFLNRFTSAEQIAVQQAALKNPQIMLGLTMGLATGAINLLDTVVAAWMQALVTAHVLTESRMKAILTP